jgi:8-oxo-dGTP pyrophosphatase MutT (NUDIX family)
MDFKSFDKKIVAAASVIYNSDNKLLLLRRGPTAPWMPGKWNLPGGNIDENESGLQAAKREAKEEINIIINNARSLGIVTEQDWGVAFFCCLHNEWSGIPKLSVTDGILENDDLAWELPESALKYPLVPTVDAAIIRSMKHL